MLAIETGHARLLTIGAIAAATWACLAILAVTVLTPATRLLSFALVTAALFVTAAYEMNKRDRAWKQAVLLLAAAWLVLNATLYAARLVAPKLEPKGPLLAADDPTPVTACAGVKLSGDALLMVVGKSGVIGRGKGPFTPFKAGSCPALAITHTAHGLMVTGFGYDSDNNVVYRIRENIFAEIVGGYLTGHRPDPSRLVVGDDHGPTVLAIRYLNRNAVQILGTFRCGDSAPVHVTESGVFAGRTAKAAPNRCVTLHGATAGLTFSAPQARQ